MSTGISAGARHAAGCLRRAKTRHDLAFQVLHPQVEVVKRSAVVQLIAAGAIAGNLLTGHLVTAAAVAGFWLGSQPLTHLAAGTCAVVGEIDDQLRRACEAMYGTVAVEKKPSTPRRRPKPNVTPAPAGE